MQHMPNTAGFPILLKGTWLVIHTGVPMMNGNSTALILCAAGQGYTVCSPGKNI